MPLGCEYQRPSGLAFPHEKRITRLSPVNTIFLFESMRWQAVVLESFLTRIRGISLFSIGVIQNGIRAGDVGFAAKVHGVVVTRTAI